MAAKGGRAIANGDSAFRQGFDARLANRSIVSCPYPGAEGDEWRAGFSKACGHLDGTPISQPELEKLGPFFPTGPESPAPIAETDEPAGGDVPGLVLPKRK